MEELKPCPFCGCTAVEIYPTLARGFFAARCAACHMYGPHSENEDCAVERWNALPRRLRWTKEKPTKSGEYRFRNKRDGEHFTDVNVEDGTVLIYGMEVIADLEELIGEWAGPIPEPIAE